jgi:hypothetical protein
MSAASLRAGTMTVIDGLPLGAMSCWGKSRLGMRGSPRAAAVTFQSQVRATSQAMSWRAVCMERPPILRFVDIYCTPGECGGSSASAGSGSE